MESFNHLSTLLASCGDDQTVRLWNILEGKCIKVLRNNRPYENMNMTNVSGLSKPQTDTLLWLGAIKEDNGVEEPSLEMIDQKINPAELRITLQERFDEGELRTLCFDLGLDYENFPGDGKINKARELVKYFQNRQQLTLLVNQLQKQRPDIR